MTATLPDVWATPDAINLLPYDAPREEWLQVRTGGIGGSDASTIAGVNKYATLYELWLDKTGRLPEKEVTAAMRWGNLLEAALLQAFTEDTGIETRRAGLMQSVTRPWQRVSLDALAGDGGIVECKTASWRVSEEWDDDQTADHAEVQIQHALAVTGRSHGWAVVLIDGRDFRFRRVERDEALIATLIEMEERFWFEHVLGDVQPDLDHRDLDTVKAQYRLATTDAVLEADDPTLVATMTAALRDAKAEVKRAEQARDVLDAQLRNILGDREVLNVDGKPVFTAKQNGTFAAARFTAAHPDLAASLMTKPSLDLDRIKAEHPDLYQAHRARVARLVTTKEK